MTENESEQQPPNGQKKGAVEKKEEEEITSYTDGNLFYRVGDTVYIESQRPDMPYFICSIRNFNRSKSKKDQITVDVVWFYRPCEIPTSVYQLLLQDRHAENGSSILDEPIVKDRELFISDAIDVYPASALRGHAYCVPFSEIKENLPEFIAKENHWFYILRYNPESRRMANAKGEIRIGASHQACPPICNQSRTSKESLAELNSTCKEELLWKPTLPESKLMVYLRAARSITSFSGYCETENGCPEKAMTALSEDQNTAYFYDVLHKNNYNISEALQQLIRNPKPKRANKPWNDDSRKRFMRGLRSYGKNFYKIRKECLPEREVSELVTYFYIWKKTVIALNSRPHKRGGRRNNVLARKTRTTKPKASEASAFVDLSSCSENDIDDTDDSENARDFSLYACRHCYSTKSPNWHHGGKDKILLCLSCRIYYKRYGYMKVLSEEERRDPPAFIFKAAFQNLDESLQFTGRMRTRRSSTPVFTNANSIRSRLLQEGKVGLQKQITAPSISENYSDKEDKEEAEVEVNELKRKSDEEDIDQLQEQKKTRVESDAEDADDESESESGLESRSELTVPLSNGEQIKMSPDAENMSDELMEKETATAVALSNSPTLTAPASTSPLENSSAEDTTPATPPMTFIPIKEEEISEETAGELERSEAHDSPDSEPDVPDDEALVEKIKTRFAHNETEAGNSCSRCERYYIHKRQKKQRPSELETSSKRREEYLRGKDGSQKRIATPPSSHQPAQITSHYETMRLIAQATRNVEPQRYWPGYQMPPEMHAHRSREFVGDPGKFGHLLEAMDRAPVDIRSPRAGSIGAHPHTPHGYPPLQEGNRDFRVNGPGRGHMPPHHVPVSLDSLSRIPTSIEGGPLERGPPNDRPPTIDPLTGLPTVQPHLHSHHHTHTHLHVHPDDLKYRGGHYTQPPAAGEPHFERHDRASTHQPAHPQQPPVPHIPSSRSREYHEQLLKQYPELLAQMHHDPHLRESLSRHVPPLGRENGLHPPREGAVSPSIPHADIPNAHSDPVAYHLWVTQYANAMEQRWNSHGGSQSHSQAPELSPHGIPQQPRIPPHDLRNEHEKHMKEKLMYAHVHAEREKLARAEHLRSLEHEKHLRSMFPNREHLDKMKNEHSIPPDCHSFKPGSIPPDCHSFKPGNIPPDCHSFKPGDVHMGGYHNNPFIDTLRRVHDGRPHDSRSIHDRSFHDSMRFNHDRERSLHSERMVHAERYPDRARHERPSIFGNYKPETIDLSED